MHLYGTTTSPFVRKLRVLAHEKGIALRFEVASPMDVDGVVRKLSPIGKVPLLIRDDGKPLYDSPVIADYLDSLSAPAWIPRDGSMRYEALRLEVLADELSDRVVDRLVEQRRPPELQSKSVVADEERRVARLIGALADELGMAAFFNGRTLGYADLCVGVALSYVDLRYPHGWRDAHQSLATWHASVKSRESFVLTPMTP